METRLVRGMLVGELRVQVLANVRKVLLVFPQTAAQLIHPRRTRKSQLRALLVNAIARVKKLLVAVAGLLVQTCHLLDEFLIKRGAQISEMLVVVMHGPVDAVYTRILRRILLHQTLLQGRVHFHYVRVLLVHAFVLRLGFLGVPGIYGCAGIRQSFVVLFHEGSELGGSLSLFRRRLRERALYLSVLVTKTFLKSPKSPP